MFSKMKLLQQSLIIILVRLQHTARHTHTNTCNTSYSLLRSVCYFFFFFAFFICFTALRFAVGIALFLSAPALFLLSVFLQRASTRTDERLLCHQQPVVWRRAIYSQQQKEHTTFSLAIHWKTLGGSEHIRWLERLTVSNIAAMNPTVDFPIIYYISGGYFHSNFMDEIRHRARSLLPLSHRCDYIVQHRNHHQQQQQQLPLEKQWR